MSLTKLDQEEILMISKKIEELHKLHQKAITEETEAYHYYWQRLDRAISKAVLEYRHILSIENRTIVK